MFAASGRLTYSCCRPLFAKTAPDVATIAATVAPCNHANMLVSAAQKVSVARMARLEKHAGSHQGLRQVLVSLWLQLCALSLLPRRRMDQHFTKFGYQRTFLKARRPATSTPAVVTAPTRTSGLFLAGLPDKKTSTSSAVIAGLRALEPSMEDDSCTRPCGGNIEFNGYSQEERW